MEKKYFRLWCKLGWLLLRQSQIPSRLATSKRRSMILPSHLHAEDVNRAKKYNQMSISQVVLGGIRKIKMVQYYFGISKYPVLSLH